MLLAMFLLCAALFFIWAAIVVESSVGFVILIITALLCIVGFAVALPDREPTTEWVVKDGKVCVIYDGELICGPYEPKEQ